MQMRHTLADPVIDSHKRTLGGQTLLHCPGQALGIGKQWPNQPGWQVKQGWVMRLWHQQTMAGKQGATIQKGQGYLVLKDDVSWHLAADDLAKWATLI
jgi:hypothetical protein